MSMLTCVHLSTIFSFFVYFCSFQTTFRRKTAVFSGIRTRIVGVEGKHPSRCARDHRGRGFHSHLSHEIDVGVYSFSRSKVTKTSYENELRKLADSSCLIKECHTRRE